MEEVTCPYCHNQMKPAPEFGIRWYKCKCGATHNIIKRRRRNAKRNERGKARRNRIS